MSLKRAEHHWLSKTGVVFLALGAGLLFQACDQFKPPKAKPKPLRSVIAASNALDEKRKSLGFEDAPSQTCGQCHGEKYATWAASKHHNTIMDAKKHPPKGDFSRSYFCDGKEVVKVFAGNHKERYVLAHPKGEQHFTVSPCEWDLVNTCMKTGDLGKPPNWIKDCAGCHTSRVNPKSGKRLEDGVACVMCHGPKSWHKTKKMAVFSPRRKKETPRQSVEICGQCHVQGGRSPDKTTQYAQGYYPFMNSLSGSYRVPFEHIREHGTGDPAKRQSYDHILYAFQSVVDGKSATTCVNCHQLHPPNWKKHAKLPEEPICKTCHVVPTNKDGRRPALVYTPDCPVCSAKGACQ